MLAFSNDYYGFIFRATQSVELFCAYEKTRIVNVRKRYSDFLGFKIKMIPRRKKLVVKSHISDKQFKTQKDKLVSQAKKIASPSKGKTELEEIRLYNSMVLGMQKLLSDCNKCKSGLYET